MHRVMAPVYSRDFFRVTRAMHCNVLTQYMYAMMRMIAFAQKYLKGVNLLCMLQECWLSLNERQAMHIRNNVLK